MFIIDTKKVLAQIGLLVLTMTYNIDAIDCIGSWGYSFIQLSWHDFRCRNILTYGTYQKERVSLHAQGTKQQVISQSAHACPKINHVMLWNKVTGSLVSLSMIPHASKISLPKRLPCLTLQQCCQLAVAHCRWKKITGSFNYSSSLHITLLKWLSPSLTMQ